MLVPAPRFAPPGDRLTYHHSERRVRGSIGDVVVVDSRQPMLVWEPGLPVPFWVFPLADLVGATLRPAAQPPDPGTRAGSSFHDLAVGGLSLPNAAWTYPGDFFSETVCLAWREWFGQGVERWYEEDEEVFVHPRDPFSRVDSVSSSRHVVVRHQDVVLADTRRPVLLFETGLPTRYYIPADDLARELLIPSDHHTRCPYKGTASYWSLRDVPGPAGRSIAWFYPEPLPEVANIAGLTAFYPERVTILVDGESVSPTTALP
ncbi:DUF427 domain-containing protein [Micromonospora rifamycinica]|uniref:Uncharacterized conserved protein, DUF427 family n=1 Tax=Micromonospora rifamycinica TaxID=291594 RepID=A0A125Q223_9ACTN|nr:DUF427 domain-containing protein [Micromonospora rifamycinica]KWV33980.1 hypothetical protein AWV63_04050 [Micromonospora rifamycinica]SCG48810.1 Uncharacterized conserved protein, DUF427 family [Micromonospora rifamycinica]